MIVTCMLCIKEMQPTGEQKFLEYTLMCPQCKNTVKVELKSKSK